MKRTHLAFGFVILFLLVVALAAPATQAAGFEGRLKLGYVYLDDDGNRSVDHTSYNLYEGGSIGLENMRYRFENGLRLRGNISHLTMNNRNLSLGLDKAGLFGLSVGHHKYRRIYSFEGDKATKRHRTTADFWLRPHRYIKLFAGGSYTQKQGDMLPLFEYYEPTPESFDYSQVRFNGGLQANYEGRTVRAEYRTINYSDEYSSMRDQQRQLMQVQAQLPLPRFEWIMVTGGFRHFESKYKDSDFTFSANTGWVSGLAQLPQGFSARYHFKFDRASSDSDFVATDNLSNAFYLGYQMPGKLRLTAGYQTDVNDDFEDEVRGDGFYLAAWAEPAPFVEVRGEYGSRKEELEEGQRLLGDQETKRHKFAVKLKGSRWGSVTFRGEGRERDNEQLGSNVEFTRFGGDLTLLGSKQTEITCPVTGKKIRLQSLVGGYSYTEGHYTNPTREFDFEDHTIHAAVNLLVAERLELGHQFVYYRSKRDLDIESIRLVFSGHLLLGSGFGVEAIYRVHNFDDLAMLTLPYDQYYTANIVEFNLTKDFSY